MNAVELALAVASECSLAPARLSLMDLAGRVGVTKISRGHSAYSRFGLLMRDKVLLNSRGTDTREGCVTLAHELCHVLMYKSQLTLHIRGSRERFCEEFAYCLVSLLEIRWLGKVLVEVECGGGGKT